MAYLLSCRHGSFAQSEIHLSLANAMTRAHAMADGEGCSSFKIERGGILVMNDAQIGSEWQRAKLAAQLERPLQRATWVARETVYLVQAFVAGKGDRLKAETPIPCKSAHIAMRTAERLGQTKLGVVALSTSGDQELGDYDDEPTILCKYGELPETFGG
jgi:hypothetical protein